MGDCLNTRSFTVDSCFQRINET